MKLKNLAFLGLAIGLLALGGWKAFSHFKEEPAASQQWVCPMRCLNRSYDRAGECPVCHMKLKLYAPAARKSLGFHCPLHRSEKVFAKGGACPYCGLQLKELFDGAPPPLPADSGRQQWPLLEGRTAVFFRPFEVRELTVERYLRGAGKVQGRAMHLRLPPEQARALRRGLSAMVRPPQGFARPVQAQVARVEANGLVRLELVRPLGSEWGLAELRVELGKGLAVPLQALSEHAGQAKVYVMSGEACAPRTVTVQARGEAYALVQGLQEGESVAGGGVFWLEAQWRMEHP